MFFKILTLFCILDSLRSTTLVDPNKFLPRFIAGSSKSELCELLQSADLSDIQIFYFTDQDYLFGTFSRDILTHTHIGFDDSDPVENKNFLKCLNNLKSKSFYVIRNDENKGYYENLAGEDPHLIFYEKSSTEDFQFSERQLAAKAPKAATKQINLGPNGFYGVIFLIIFVLIVYIYLMMLHQTGEFNVKFVKEKMPFGKEY